MLPYQDIPADINSFRIPNFIIEDGADLFISKYSKIKYYPVSNEAFNVNNISIKLNLFTFNNDQEFSMFYNKPAYLSNNEMIVYIYRKTDKLNLKVKLSNELLKASRFNDQNEAGKFLKVIEEREFKTTQTITIKHIINLLKKDGIPIFLDILLQRDSKYEKPIRLISSGKVSKDDILKNRSTEKDTLNVTIGLFFDGTNNSKFSTEKVCNNIYSEVKNGKAFSDILAKLKDFEYREEFKKKFGIKDNFMFDDGCSYLNDFTNIYYLWNLYETKDYDKNDPSNEIIIKQYIQGIGPNARLNADGEKVEEYFEDENVIGKGMGKGIAGVESRFNEAVHYIVNQLLKLTKDNKKKLESITFDVFGFSRGASVARLFHNRLSTVYTNISPDITNHFKSDKMKVERYENGYLGYVSSQKELDLPKKDYIKVRFMGLYDTVLKVFGGNVYGGADENDISLRKSDAIVCQIQSKFEGENSDDEYRKNFPLVLNDAKNKIDISLFGSHSDIGGSYVEKTYSTVLSFESTAKIFSGEHSSSALLKDKDIYMNKYAVLFDKKENRFKYKADQISATPNIKKNSIELKDDRFIENKIVLVSLFAMVKVANCYKLPFPNISNSFSEISDIISKLTNQKDFKITNNTDDALSNYNNLVQDLINEWINGKKEIEKRLNKKDFCTLYHNYIHISSDYNEFQLIDGLRDSVFNSNYINEPADNKKRVSFLS